MWSGLTHLLVYLLDVDEKVVGALRLVRAVRALDTGANAALGAEVPRQRRFRAVYPVAVRAEVAAHETTTQRPQCAQPRAWSPRQLRQTAPVRRLVAQHDLAARANPEVLP